MTREEKRRSVAERSFRATQKLFSTTDQKLIQEIQDICSINSDAVIFQTLRKSFGFSPEDCARLNSEVTACINGMDEIYGFMECPDIDDLENWGLPLRAMHKED